MWFAYKIQANRYRGAKLDHISNSPMTHVEHVPLKRCWFDKLLAWGSQVLVGKSNLAG